MKRKTYWKTTIVYEVLSEGETALPDDMSLQEIVRECYAGGFSGDTKKLLSVQVGVETMARLLIDQNSDAEFLLGDEITLLCPTCLKGARMESAHVDELRELGSPMFCDNKGCDQEMWRHPVDI